MGAVLYAGGTTFRVWAPNASAVTVAGSFNDWSPSADALAHEGNGYWSGDVPLAREGHEYRYVISHAGQVLLPWRVDPYARAVTNPGGNGIIHADAFDWGVSPFQMPDWNELIIYELHVGTFNDVPGDSPGHLRAAIERLPYLRDLGINAVELLPPAEFHGGYSWGYNPGYPFAVEREYGGPEALKAFIKAAHEHGIAVIIDVVYNHLGPEDVVVWRFDGWHQDDFGGIYFYNDGRAWTPWGARNRPDYGRGEVRQYLRDNALMWLEEYRADGLRWDATAFIRNVYGSQDDPGNDLPDGWSLMQWINREIAQRQPWKISIAEDLRNNPWLIKDDEGGAGFDGEWDPEFVHPVRHALITPSDEQRSMAAVQRSITHRYGADAFERVIYTESHDEVANGRARVPHEINPADPASWHAKKRSTLGAALVLTSPGIPMLFQGQEFLEDEWFHDEDPLDWSKLERFAGIVQLYRDLIRLRRNWFDHTRGLRGQHVHAHHVNDFDKVIAYHRWDQGGPSDSVVVVANFGHRGYPSYRLGFPAQGRWRVRCNSDWAGYDPSFGSQHSYDTEATPEPRDGMLFAANVGLAPYSAIILSQDR
jgi:1,4-alpha-glucan branching enzyme